MYIHLKLCRTYLVWYLNFFLLVDAYISMAYAKLMKMGMENDENVRPLVGLTLIGNYKDFNIIFFNNFRNFKIFFYKFNFFKFLI